MLDDRYEKAQHIKGKNNLVTDTENVVSDQR
jgi:hypothetical protein